MTVLCRYIVFNVPVHANATLGVVNHWFSVSEILAWVGRHSLRKSALTLTPLQAYVNVLYPMSAVAFCASIYMTLAVTVER